MSFRKRNTLILVALSVLAIPAACGKQATTTNRIQTAAVERRTIVVQAEATGQIEPINVVEVKSRASGQITEMPVETGTLVRPGDLIVQLDTRDVQNSYDQAKADLDVAEADLANAERNKQRNDQLFAQQIITAQEYESSNLTYQNKVAAIVRARTNLDLAQQRLDDARVTAPVLGTIIDKPVALGQVIQSGTNSVSGGTTIVKMADLTKVRARALVNETDIGRVRAGQDATVIVDAFPDRVFAGTIEKIEPQAVVQQNVTMFPVLVSLENRDGALLPGMNGEVAIISDRRENVVAVPNDAIRTMREAQQGAAILGIDPDSVQAQLRAGGMGMFGGGFGGPAGGASGAMGAGGPRPQGAPGQAGTQRSPGFVALASDSQSGQSGQGAQGGQRPQGNGAPGGFQLPDVTDAQCKAIETARTAKPAAAKKIDSLTALMRDPNADRMALMGDIRTAYTELGVDQNVARACRVREGNAGGPGGAPTGAPTGANGPNAGAGRPNMGNNGITQGRNFRQGFNGGQGNSGTRTGLVFVQRADSTWEARVVRLGVADYDYTEVVSGLHDGDRVAILSASLMQLQREQSQNQIRQMQSGSSPLGSSTGGARPAGGPSAGGGPR